ncbi:amino acid ABC transporter permease [Azospirillum sp.]|uniref:amino acid ABC transporter permease n=1 Tax=Azospirillum sp. TaxID=34012 RepID=UPI003D717189
MTPPPSTDGLPPPVVRTGPWRWMRANLFYSPWSTVATLLFAALFAVLAPPLLRWAVLDATWAGSTRDACLDTAGGLRPGACWVFVKVRFGQLMYGFYPVAQRWRVDAVALTLVLALAAVLPWRPVVQRVAALAGAPFAGAVLAWTAGGWTAALAAAYLAAPLLLVADHAALDRLRQRSAPVRAAGVLAVAAAAGWAGGALAGAPWAAAWVALVLGAGVLGLRFRTVRAAALYLLALVFPLLAYALLVGGGPALPVVPTEQWGGLFLTLTIGLTGMGASLPLGVLLALGRRSDLPVVRLSCIGFIEFIRGVPMITVLFLASVMLPLFLPEGVGIDKLLRALIGVALFSAAYMAEVVRGGLQAIPPGQREAAESLGLGRVAVMALVVLPQALRIVIPGIVNTFIGLLKDTSLVAVIGLLDLIGMIKTATSDPNWLGFASEGYVFVGLVFWVLCYGMARYSLNLEQRLRAGAPSS